MFDLDISAFKAVRRRPIDDWSEETSPDKLADLPMLKMVEIDTGEHVNHLLDIDREAIRIGEWADREAI